MSDEQRGIWNAVLAYVIWGVFPLFWKLLGHVSSMEVLASRIIWSCVITTIFIVVIGQRKKLAADLRFLWQTKKQFLSLFAASMMISLNWFIYIWAVSNEQILQASLGYYINPLISVLFGLLFFKEKLSRATIVAVLIAAVGVVVLTTQTGTVPWISLTLALSFAVYGVLKKKIVLDATRGLAMETLFVLPLALMYLAYLASRGELVFLHMNVTTDVLLIISGAVTAIPLVLFAKSAKQIPLYLMGFIQYLSPTLGLLIGVFIYKEPFTTIDLVAFSCIWAALVLFSVSKVVEIRRRH